MIRQANPDDAAEIAAIYNKYVTETTISFETEPVSVSEMRDRILAISSSFPYLVCERGGHIVGYSYAHLWKERAAYARTLETTIYVASDCRGQGIGSTLMRTLIETCRKQGARALIACITDENKSSVAMHARLGFKQVSQFEKVGIKFGRELGVTDMELLL